MPVRTVLFVDYQNVYHSARQAFHLPGDRSYLGHSDPVGLGERLIGRSPGRALREVRVYRGRPDKLRDPVGYGANVQQAEAWDSAGARVITRVLRYPSGWPNERPIEKGIDVALAVDFVAMALLDQYDVGILLSTDTDLKPALEAVAGFADRPYPICEIAAWSYPKGRHSPRLSIKGTRLWCHWLMADNYAAVADPTDYRVGKGAALAAPGGPGAASRRRRAQPCLEGVVRSSVREVRTRRSAAVMGSSPEVIASMAATLG